MPQTFTLSNSRPARIASSVCTPSSSSSAVPSIDLLICLINALLKTRNEPTHLVGLKKKTNQDRRYILTAHFSIISTIHKWSISIVIHHLDYELTLWAIYITIFKDICFAITLSIHNGFGFPPPTTEWSWLLQFIKMYFIYPSRWL